MSHSYNRRVFSQLINFSEPLIALYSSLVRLELTLKDHDPSFFNLGHKITTMLDRVGVNSSYVEQLKNSLTALTCTSKSNMAISVDYNNFPTMRYLRHIEDFAGTSTDTQLIQLLGILRDIELELKTKGVSI